MLFFKGLLTTFAVACTYVSADIDAMDKKSKPFNDAAKCGMTPFLYAKVNRGLINIVNNVAANLPCEVPAEGSKLFFTMVDRLIVANPCKEDAAALAAFVSKQPSVIHGSKDAKRFATKLNNFYRQAIGLPIREIEYMDKNFKPTFTLGQSMAVFEFMQLAAMKLPENLDKAARQEAVDVMGSVSELLPGNQLSVFLKEYLRKNPPQIVTGNDARQYLCAMHNAYSDSNFLSQIDCANLEKYYGPNTIAW